MSIQATDSTIDRGVVVPANGGWESLQAVAVPATRQSAQSMGRGEAIVATVILSMLLFLPAIKLFFYSGQPVRDPDVWWHIRTGQWMLEHRTWPTTDPFSSYASGRPWHAYSWVPELALYGLHKAFGLRGIVMYTAILSVAIVAAFHFLIRRLQPNFLRSGILTVVAVLGLSPLMMPRPWLVTILCFVIELDLLLSASRTGNYRRLLWLVPLFCLWANSHAQFSLGLAILGLAVVEAIVARLVPARMVNDGRLCQAPIRWMVFVFTLCIASTLINPYHYHLYTTAVALAGQLSQLENEIQEFRAMSFRTIADWTVLGVVLGTAFAVGWRRGGRLLWVPVAGMAVYFSFHSGRDIWFVLLLGLTILADTGSKAEASPSSAPKREKWVVSGIVAVLLGGAFLLLSERNLEAKVAEVFPVGAVEFVKAGKYSGPLFNSYDSGGYLIFSLPRVAVSIDGRGMAHGSERIAEHCKTLKGAHGWRDNSELSKARLVILEKKFALASLLQLDPRFQAVYVDKVAVVLVASPGGSGGSVVHMQSGSQ